MSDMNSHNLSYKGLNVTLTVRDKIYISTGYKTEDLNLVTVDVKRANGNNIHLGNFYIKLPKLLDEVELHTVVKYLIDNIDFIIFENDRYVGNLVNGSIEKDDDVKEKLSEKFFNYSNEELGNIYTEFLSFDPNSKDNEKYSRFLELYFYSHPIPDSIKGIFLGRKRHSLLYYDDLDYEIKRDFCGKYKTSGISDYEHNLKLLEEIKFEIESTIKEIYILENILTGINDLLLRTKNNIELQSEIDSIESKLKNMRFFDRGKRDQKEKLNKLKKLVEPLNADMEKNLLKEKINNYADEFKDAQGLISLFDTLSIENLRIVINELYETKCKSHSRLVNTYNDVFDTVEYQKQNQIDISDLYERIDKEDVQQKR